MQIISFNVGTRSFENLKSVLGKNFRFNLPGQEALSSLKREALSCHVKLFPRRIFPVISSPSNQYNLNRNESAHLNSRREKIKFGSLRISRNGFGSEDIFT